MYLAYIGSEWSPWTVATHTVYLFRHSENLKKLLKAKPQTFLSDVYFPGQPWLFLLHDLKHWFQWQFLHKTLFSSSFCILHQSFLMLLFQSFIHFHCSYNYSRNRWLSESQWWPSSSPFSFLQTSESWRNAEHAIRNKAKSKYQRNTVQIPLRTRNWVFAYNRGENQCLTEPEASRQGYWLIYPKLHNWQIFSWRN